MYFPKPYEAIAIINIIQVTLKNSLMKMMIVKVLNSTCRAELGHNLLGRSLDQTRWLVGSVNDRMMYERWRYISSIMCFSVDFVHIFIDFVN